MKGSRGNTFQALLIGATALAVGIWLGLIVSHLGTVKQQDVAEKDLKQTPVTLPVGRIRLESYVSPEMAVGAPGFALLKVVNETVPIGPGMLTDIDGVLQVAGDCNSTMVGTEEHQGLAQPGSSSLFSWAITPKSPGACVVVIRPKIGWALFGRGAWHSEGLLSQVPIKEHTDWLAALQPIWTALLAALASGLAAFAAVSDRRVRGFRAARRRRN